MTIPRPLVDRLAIRAIVAPMFLISGPDLVVEYCRAGLLGTFPALDQHGTEGFDAWFDSIAVRRAGTSGGAPFGVNLIVDRSNARLDTDLARQPLHRRRNQSVGDGLVVGSRRRRDRTAQPMAAICAEPIEGYRGARAAAA